MPELRGRPPIHLKPVAELAERVLLPGDPHRALAVAQDLLEQPRMFNHQRGLWGYTGLAPDGERLTVQATGMGGASAAIVVEELIDLGVRTLLRIGTCGALDGGLALGELVVARELLPRDGTSLALGARGRLVPETHLTEALAGAGARPVVAVSTDVFYDDRAELAARWLEDGAQVVEMEAAAIVRVAERRGAVAACLLAVSDLVAPHPGAGNGRTRIAPDALAEAELRLGRTAFEALRAIAR